MQVTAVLTIVGASSIEGTGSTGVLLRKNDAALTMSGLMTVNGVNAIGIDIKTSGTKAALDGPGSVQVSGTDAVGIKLGSDTETTIDSWNLNVADSSAGAGIELGNNSKLELKNVASQAAADGVLLRAAGTATVNVDGSSHLVGDVLHDGTVSGTLALAFAEGSSLTGKVNEQGAGVINLEMDNAVWKLSGDSSLHQLTLNNGAAVHLTHSGGYHTLTAQELQGSGGLFKLDLDVRSLESDKLAITDASSGSHVLDIYQKDAYEPSAGSTEGHGLVLGSVTGTADFTAKDREGSLFYKHYELGSKASETAGYDTDWYLDKIISVDPGDKTTTTVKTIMGAAALNYHTWRTDNDQLLQRLGTCARAVMVRTASGCASKALRSAGTADSASRINILPMSWATTRCCGKLMIIPAMAAWPSAMATAAAVMLVAVALTIIKPLDYMVRKSTKRDIIWTWCSNTPIWIMILAFWIQKGKKSAAITITRDLLSAPNMGGKTLCSAAGISSRRRS